MQESASGRRATGEVVGDYGQETVPVSRQPFLNDRARQCDRGTCQCHPSAARAADRDILAQPFRHLSLVSLAPAARAVDT